MSQIQSTSRPNCVLLAVLCGRYAEKLRTPARLAPEAKRMRLSYPLPELGSSGRLEVHKLINPTVEQFREAQRAVQPNLLYLQGQQLENEKEIGTLVWGDADVSDLQTFSSLINPLFPTIGVGNTLKRHYETYLLEYELSHDDVDGECCLLCHSSAPGDWVNCGLCGEWARFGCDRRQGLGTFKDYAKTDGLEYICPHCSLANYKKKPPPSERVTNGFANTASASRNV